MSIINVTTSQQAASNPIGMPFKKDKAHDKTEKSENPAATVSVSGGGASKHSAETQAIKDKMGITDLDNETSARNFMDSTKAGMLADPGATIMAQSQQSAERVNELIS